MKQKEDIKGDTLINSDLSFLAGRTVVITGATSMLGRHISDHLHNNVESIEIWEMNHREGFDLTSLECARNMVGWLKCDYIIHLASLNGNIQYNSKYPADIFYTTAQCGINILKAAAEITSEERPIKVISILSSCSYPDTNDGILFEENYWNGSPNPSVEAHGFSKRVIMEYGRQLYKQYGLMSVGVIYNTAYGEYDNTDVDKTKVVMGLIKKFVDAKVYNKEEVVLWGSGEPRREFIYAGDIARTIPLVMKSYDNPILPLNIGNQAEYSIKELAENINEIVGFKGKVVWDGSKPNGQMRKLLSSRTFRKTWGNVKFTTLKEGLNKTIKWYWNQVEGKNNDE